MQTAEDVATRKCFIFNLSKNITIDAYDFVCMCERGRDFV